MAGERGGAAADLHSMRGAQLGCVYWLLCAIYLYATLGSVVASGGSGAVPAQLAASAPALLVGVPVAARETTYRNVPGTQNHRKGLFPLSKMVVIPLVLEDCTYNMY